MRCGGAEKRGAELAGSAPRRRQTSRIWGSLDVRALRPIPASCWATPPRRCCCSYHVSGADVCIVSERALVRAEFRQDLIASLQGTGLLIDALRNHPGEAQAGGSLARLLGRSLAPSVLLRVRAFPFLC